jgi:tetratricopeptide (TPR) repeat protein
VTQLPAEFQRRTQYLVISSWLFFSTLCMSPLLSASTSDIEQGLAEYATAMESSDRNLRLQLFARAEQLFRQAVEDQIAQSSAASTELLVNLGNAALQAEHIGPAILAYRRALWQQPRHARAIQNLQFARGLLPESLRADQDSQWIDTLFFWKQWLSRLQLRLLAAGCFWSAAVILTLSVIMGLPALRLLALTLGLIWTVLLVSDWWEPLAPTTQAVVVVDEALLYAADSENSPLRLADPLPDGTEVRVLERRERWIEIEVRGRSGWLSASHVELLQPETKTNLPAEGA